VHFIDKQTCHNDGGCIEACPISAIERYRGAVLITAACNDCGLCVAACPTGSIQFQSTPGKPGGHQGSTKRKDDQ
jgi:Fe-S-cluster-containing hydrogenase component 2